MSDKKRKKEKQRKKQRKKNLPAFLYLSGSLTSLTFYLDTFPGPFVVFVDLIRFTLAVTGLALFWGHVGVGFSAFTGSRGAGTIDWTG